MDLILKPTQVCNFKCTFCSSTKITESNADFLNLDYVFAFLKRFPSTRTIIVNGGDPTMMKPDYYWKLIEFIEDHSLPTTLSWTSNLWDFYKNPNKWVDLFRHPRFGVCTSFQYDVSGGRLKPDYTAYTEEDFWKVSDRMLSLVGYRPDFISVVTEENKHLAIKNVELAKKMSEGLVPGNIDGQKTGVECKLNYANASGPVKWGMDRNGNLTKMGQEGDPFSKAQMYSTYVDIFEMGLHPWEYNTKQMMRVLKDKGGSTTCPSNRNCDAEIRCLQPTTNKSTGKETVVNRYFSCGAFGDDLDKSIDFEEEVVNGKIQTPLRNDPELFSLKKSCVGCPMFSLCNGCYKYIKDAKSKGSEFVEDHCLTMKSLAKKIMKINEFSEKEIDLLITPYIQES